MVVFFFRNVFFFDVFDPFNAMQVCVTKCPTEDLKTKEQVKKFAEETGSKLCRYDIPVEDYLDQEFGKQGPCPSLPIFERYYLCVCIFLADPCYLQCIRLVPLCPRSTGICFKWHGSSAKERYHRILQDLWLWRYFPQSTKWLLLQLAWDHRPVCCGCGYVDEAAMICVIIIPFEVIAFVMVLLMRFLASVIVWMIVILAAIGSIGKWYQNEKDSITLLF